MRKLINTKCRDSVKNNIKDTNSVLKTRIDKKIKISNIDSTIKYINNKQKKAKESNYKYLEDELTLANISILCLSNLSLSVHTEKFDEEIFPRNWLSESSLPNPNFILSNLLLQLTNYSMSIIDLLEKGLDNPARALLRTTSELSEQIIILIHSRNDFKEYVKGHDEAASTKIWYELFSKNKIRNKLSSIEEQIGLDDKLIEYMKNYRKESNEFFSQAVHHSYIAVNVGACAWEYNSDGYINGLFGGENSAIETTLGHLNTTLWFFLISFFRKVVKPKNPKELLWIEAFLLQQSVQSLYMDIYFK